MKVDWNELTLQEKKAGMSPLRVYREAEPPMPQGPRLLRIL
jgi:hypothetical protein